MDDRLPEGFDDWEDLALYLLKRVHRLEDEVSNLKEEVYACE